MKKRLCKECGGRMRPTRELSPICDSFRIFRCCDCGVRASWLDKPNMNGSFADLHRTKDGSFSMLSMMSDPEMTWVLHDEKKLKSKRTRTRKVRRK